MYKKSMDELFNELFMTPRGLKEVPRYPLTDIAIDENENLYIEVAVAGFSKEDITIDIKGDKLIIQGVYSDSDDLVDLKYVQRHISTKDFERIIKLNDVYIDGEVNASMEDGILSVIIQRKEPTKTSIAIK